MITHLPQAGKMHFSVAISSPEHSRPVREGSGLLHSLDLMRLPAPQVLVHLFHGLQSPQPPSTAVECQINQFSDCGHQVQCLSLVAGYLIKVLHKHI